MRDRPVVVKIPDPRDVWAETRWALECLAWLDDPRFTVVRREFTDRKGKPGMYYTRRRIPKRERPFCAAVCKDGHGCRARALPGMDRCRTHSGLRGAGRPDGDEEPVGRLLSAIEAMFTGRPAASSEKSKILD